jgi:transposase-like protein
MKKNMDWKSFEESALSKLKNGEKLEGKDGVMAPLIKHLLETALGGELDAHLKEEKTKKKKNRKNGKGKKGLKTSYGKIELETSRDREGSFDPKIIKKRQTTLGDGLDSKIISMYSRGMSYEDIRVHFEELYGLELSKAHISGVTDKVWTEITAWQNRPLDRMYPIIWMDAIHYKVRHEGRVESRAVYVVLGVDKTGHKDLLALHTSENEGAKFWLQVLTDLQNRGVEDVLIACIDNLSGFSEAIGSIFPKTEVQLCVVHQIRNSLKYITSEDQKVFLKDLKLVYQASTKETALKKLDGLEKTWGAKYPVVIKSWRKNWDQLTAYFKYAQPIRKIIYTTNTVEGFNRQLRKITKSKAVFPNEDALLKLIWLVSQNILKKWTSPLQKWALTAQQLYIHFPDRFEMDLNMGDDS